MDYAVILSLKAVGDLEAIVQYVGLSNPDVMRKVGLSLLARAKELGQFPFRGQPVPEFFNRPDIRQSILKPFRIVYRVEEEKKRVSIIRFWYLSQANLEP
ncbi:MAG: type II toxin-antitoxin system RelE/ParE family toxin [Cyanobacteria bacterium J06639_14]